MIMKSEFEKTKIVLSDCRDSVFLLNRIVLSQDSLIIIKDQKTQILNDNIGKYKEIVETKDEIITIKDNKIKHITKQRNIGYGVGILSILLSVLVVL
jgi:hypothetical protein